VRKNFVALVSLRNLAWIQLAFRFSRDAATGTPTEISVESASEAPRAVTSVLVALFRLERCVRCCEAWNRDRVASKSIPDVVALEVARSVTKKRRIGPRHATHECRRIC
jgi:hypothetical protein